MRSLLNPKWILLINTLPVAILFVLFFSEYQIIKTLLHEENIRTWINFAAALGGLTLLNALFSLRLSFAGKEVPWWYGFVSFAIYIPFLLIYSSYDHELIPFDIPRWMVPGDMIIYVGTFLMPTLAYSLLLLVVHFTSDEKKHSGWKSFLAAVIVPLGTYLFFQLILPLWKPTDRGFSDHVMIIGYILATLFFLFFAARCIYILATRRSERFAKYNWIIYLFISLIFPFLGLALNNGVISNGSFFNADGIFGNFSNPWFYILAALNGLFVSLPNKLDMRYRLWLFIGRWFSFSYTLYFFIVFLPFLPLSLIAVVLIGTGLLMLTPSALFVIHINLLSGDFRFLRARISALKLRLVAILSFLIIPLSITGVYLKDRITLYEALDYLYSPDYSEPYSIDKESLENTIDVVIHHKDRNRGSMFGLGVPYLSSWYNYIVFNNLTLSDSKINYLQKVFFGKATFELRQAIDSSADSVTVSKVDVESFYDPKQQAWKSWVNLELKNNSVTGGQAQFVSNIDLPEGCWISDYYLYVGKKKEMGILAEKKAAMWVYSQIVNTRRDPGILHYLTGNKVAFRVFPFEKNEVRRTGIEFLHKQMVNVTIGGKVVQLGKPHRSDNVSFNDKSVVYISPYEKQKLPQIERKPYFHFLVDVSAGKEQTKAQYAAIIGHLDKAYPELARNARVSFVASTVEATSVKDWKSFYEKQSFSGGFFLDRAIRKTLFQSYQDVDNSYPVILAITTTPSWAILDKDFSDLRMTYPESPYFFVSSSEGNIETHSLIDNPVKKVEGTIDSVLNKKVYKYQNGKVLRYLAIDNAAGILLKDQNLVLPEETLKAKDWNSALQIYAKGISQVLHPERSKEGWIDMVRYSFITKVMNPHTAYLVVENEAQKAALKRKQEQILNSNKSLDPGDDIERMSEPELLAMAVLFGMLIWIWQKKKEIRNRASIE